MIYTFVITVRSIPFIVWPNRLGPVRSLRAKALRFLLLYVYCCRQSVLYLMTHINLTFIHLSNSCRNSRGDRWVTTHSVYGKINLQYTASRKFQQTSADEGQSSARFVFTQTVNWHNTAVKLTRNQSITTLILHYLIFVKENHCRFGD